MKKIFRSVVIIMLSLSTLLSLCSCHMEESYKEFYIKKITDNVNENYFESDKFDFAKIESVVLIPEIKAINHGEYIIYISAYSETGTENIVVKNVILKENKDDLLNYELNKEIQFDKTSEVIYEGWIDGGTFTEDAIEISDGKEFDLIVQVENMKNDTTISENITFEIVVKGYKSFVTPT